MSDIAIAVARMEEIVKIVQQSNGEVRQDVKEMSQKVTKLETDFTLLKDRFDAAAPTIAEFIATKQQVQGAGKLGRVLWSVGVFVLGGAAWGVGLYDKVLHMFKG